MISKLGSVSLTARFLVMLVCMSVVIAIVAISLFHMIRSHRMNEALALQLGVISAKISPLIAQAEENGDSQTRTHLIKSLFAFPAVSCVHLVKNQDSQLIASWPAKGCGPSPLDILVPAEILICC